jgi:D-galactarolactone cycloisomerase
MPGGATQQAPDPIRDGDVGGDPFTVASLRAIVLRAPIARPVRTAFGTMPDRPALVVRAEDTDGTVGWGEVWCNFPSCGAAHRARLIETEILPLVLARPVDHPAATHRWLGEALRLLVLQTGEIGPIAQALAGVDIALWDIAAQRAAMPLWRILGAKEGRVASYASGLGPDDAPEMALRQRTSGHRAFKLKIGFDEARDLANLRALRDALGAEATIMADANQAWPRADAARLAAACGEFALAWLEEPIAADATIADWQALAAAAPMPLAAGENMRGAAQFGAAARSGAFGFLQPDIGKWGGISGCLEIARAAREAGVTYCPHWLGGGIGLIASAHLLAAVGGGGLLEIDANDNPLREGLAQPFPVLASGGWLDLGTAPGIGVAPDPACLADFGGGR